jgi:phage tail-like protein
MPDQAQSQLTSRVYSAAHFQLDLGETEKVGFLKSVEGGGYKAEHIVYQGGSGHPIHKLLGKPKLEDVKLQVGMAMSEVFYAWIEGFFTGQVIRKHGSIIAGDFHYKERARRNFFDALIAEVGFPALDASNKNPCYMNVTLTPERMEYVKGSGKEMDRFIGNMAQKLWTSSKFKFEIKGFEQACRRCHKVDAFTVKQKIAESPSGRLRYPVRVPGRIEWPNITFSVPEADADPFIEHFVKHVVKGEPQEDARREGEIEFLDHQGIELAKLILKGIDIANIVHDKADAGTEDIKAVKIEIAVESMQFVYGDMAMLE